MIQHFQFRHEYDNFRLFALGEITYVLPGINCTVKAKIKKELSITFDTAGHEESNQQKRYLPGRQHHSFLVQLHLNSTPLEWRAIREAGKFSRITSWERDLNIECASAHAPKILKGSFVWKHFGSLALRRGQQNNNNSALGRPSYLD